MGWVGLTHLLVLAVAPALSEGCCQERQRQRSSGEPHTRLCTVRFGFQRTFSLTVQWYSSGDGDPGQMVLIGQQEEQKCVQRKMKSLKLNGNECLISCNTRLRERLNPHETQVTQGAYLPAAAELHLHHIVTCLAANAVGTTSANITLQRQDAGRWLAAAAVCPVVCVVLLTGLVVTVRVHTLELTLIYRSYWQSTNYGGEDRKDIDVFLSHACSHPSEDGTGRDTSLLSFQSGEHGSQPSSEAHTPLEVLLRLCLEGSGYQLFLLERDLLPGGVYTEDVVGILQRSRCLVYLLSSDFISNSSAVFVLEAGVQALLRDPHLRVLVIWTEPRPASMAQLDQPLPRLVHRALRVLPGLDWLPGLPPDSSRSFWKSLWKAMPKPRGVPLTQSSLVPADCNQTVCSLKALLKLSVLQNPTAVSSGLND
ncbi:Interleukin-18 receptor accessory protein [Merluccius polli]|uniref:Interleukin-18 receptor accessory protein n=1 Tax=Merluccius polli TaxID=89951 RepID=A0AA47NQ39_MERPO|nr:Interleukin-18 receptor accessory protein [Merluccius polli]